MKIRDLKRSKLDVELTLLYALCDAVQTPTSVWVKALAEAKLWRKLTQLKVDPAEYEDADSFADDYLVASLLKKSNNLPVKTDREQKAVAAFYAAEARCAETNARLARGNFPSWVFDVQKRFRQILGPLTRGRLDRIMRLQGFGPGNTVGMSGVGYTSSHKYDWVDVTLTPNLVPFCRAIMGEPWWEHQRTARVVVDGNEFFTVLKDAENLRGCAKEPLINQYLQTGIGNDMVLRLRLFGVDLSTQNWNQKLAEEAYSRGLATLDLTQASDNNADGLVYLLCTTEWYHLLQLARSPVTRVGDEVVVLEKHSSMGNGYTFPLETAIFKSVVDSVVCDPSVRRHSTAVYGDDIIVPQWAAKEVIHRLEFLGFQVNGAKSHLAGDFFESCGKDFFRGVPVRPFYAREEPDGDDQEGEPSVAPYELKLCNRVRHYAAMRGGGLVCDGRFKEAWLTMRRMVVDPWRKCRVPSSFGDSGILSSAREIADYQRRLGVPCEPYMAHQVEGLLTRYVVTVPMRFDRKQYGVVLAAMRAVGSSSEPSYGREPRRGYLRRPMVRVGRVLPDQGFVWPE